MVTGTRMEAVLSTNSRSLGENSPDCETLCNHGIIHPVAA